MFEDRTVDPPPPYTSMASATGKSQITNSSYEMEEEDDFVLDFKLNDDAATQPYLSLGLTPLSQQSPPDHRSDSYYFPSMLPPVTPADSVFSISKSDSGSGIPVDSPFNISGGGGMVMPEANPISEHSTGSTVSRKSRKSKHDVPTHSQGYAMKLEPVPEQGSSLDDSYSKTNGIMDVSTSSNSNDDPNGLLFPSADLNSDYKLPPHLQRKTGKRLKSGTRRKFEEDHLNSNEDMVLRNHAYMHSPPVKLSLEDNNTLSYSPRQEGKMVRQQTRELELARQKEILRQKKLEAEKTRLLNRSQRTAKIAQDYGSTRQHELKHEVSRHNVVFQEALRYEAQLELMDDEPKPNTIKEMSNQFSVL